MFKVWEESQKLPFHEVFNRNRHELRNLIRQFSFGIKTTLPVLEGLPLDNLHKLKADIERVFEIKNIASASRDQWIVYPRHIYSFMCKTLKVSTLKQCGEVLGGRDHSTILHGCDVAMSLLERNDITFVPYWVKYLSEGDKFFTAYFIDPEEAEVSEMSEQPQVKLPDLKIIKRPDAKYSNKTALGIAGSYAQ